MLLFGYSTSTLATSPTRIVSLDLCSDWLVLHYAQPHQQIFTSPTGKRFGLPQTPNSYVFHDGSLEQIISLKPDLVIVGEFNAFMLRQRLKSLGINVLTTPLPTQLADIEHLERLLSKAMGFKLSKKQRHEVNPLALKHKRLLLLSANGYGIGHNTLEHSLIKQAGWTNYIKHSGHVKLNLENITLDPPDAIVWSNQPFPALANQFGQHPVLKRAVAAKNWLTTDQWRWQCPGPWMHSLIKQLNP
jgi:iron complex transport system substrate-binding protein